MSKRVSNWVCDECGSEHETEEEAESCEKVDRERRAHGSAMNRWDSLSTALWFVTTHEQADALIADAKTLVERHRTACEAANAAASAKAKP